MSDIKTKLGRRAFFRRSASFAAGAAVATAALPVVQEVGKVFAQGTQASGDDTMAMHRDLIRALQKPITDRKWLPALRKTIYHQTSCTAQWQK